MRLPARSDGARVRLRVRGDTAGVVHDGCEHSINETSIRVLIADCCPASEVGLHRFLSPQDGFCVTSAKPTADDVLRLATEVKPEVILLDVAPPKESGIALCHQIVSSCQGANVVLLSWLDDDRTLCDAWLAGAAGLLPRQVSREELLSAVRAAGRGRMLFTPEQRQRIRAWQEVVCTRLTRLSTREREVLLHIMDGQGNREMARALHISENTMEKHVSSILVKFGMQSRAQLISFCYRHGVQISTATGVETETQPLHSSDIGGTLSWPSGRLVAIGG